MPRRDDLSLKQLARFLPHLHLFEVLGPQHFRVRLCGTSMARVLGCDSTGSELTAENDDDLSCRTMTVVRRVLDARAPVLVFTERGAAVGTQIHSVESIWLPLSMDGVGVDQILSAAAVTVLPEFAEHAADHGGKVQA